MRTKTLLLSTAVATLLAFGPPAMSAEEPIGAVVQQKPSNAVAIPATGGAERPLPYQAAVYQNDTVVTKQDGTQLRFTDETLLTVSSNSKFKLDSFVFQKDTGTLSGSVTLGVGVFRLVTGALVKHDNLDMVTPVSVLSIRGTNFVVAVDRDGTTLVRLYEGRVRIKTCAGKYVWIHAGQRITISPTCMLVMQNVGTGATVADTGSAGDSANPADGSGGGDPSGGSGGGDPSGGPGGGGPSGGNDPGNGHADNGRGNGGDPGAGGGTHGHGSAS